MAKAEIHQLRRALDLAAIFGLYQAAIGVALSYCARPGVPARTRFATRGNGIKAVNAYKQVKL